MEEYIEKDEWITADELAKVCEQPNYKALIAVKALSSRMGQSKSRASSTSQSPIKEYNPKDIQALLDQGVLTIKQSTSTRLNDPDEFLKKYNLTRPAQK